MNQNYYCPAAEGSGYKHISTLDLAALELAAEVAKGRLDVAAKAADLLVELWPKPASATVHLETHQWIRLRRLLLETVEMGAESC